jgi:hypothetical protein
LKVCARLIGISIHNVFKDKYFLYYPSLPCLKPKLIAARNPVFSQSKDFSSQHRLLFKKFNLNNVEIFIAIIFKMK